MTAETLLHVNFRAPPGIKNAFFEKCRNQGELPASVLRRLMVAYAANEITTQPTQRLMEAYASSQTATRPKGKRK